MKKQLLLIAVFLILVNSVFGQIGVYVKDIKTNKSVRFNDIFSEYDLDKTLPTMVITWSGTFCGPCIRLIDRYNQCDLSMMNIITINIDREENLEKALARNFHANWNNSINFHGNIKDGENGFDYIFNTSTAPLILYLENGKISDAVINYNIFPYRLIELDRIKNVKFIWNSSEDLNGLAWDYYLDEDDISKLEEAIPWVERSIELDKNYNNVDTHAALLFKTGKYTSALKKAKEAIDIAKENDTDYETTTKLINQIIEKL